MINYVDFLQCIDNFIRSGENMFAPKAIGANVSVFELSFLSSFCSINIANLEARKLPSVIRTYCCPVIGCLKTNPPISVSAALIAL